MREALEGQVGIRGEGFSGLDPYVVLCLKDLMGSLKRGSVYGGLGLR